MFSAFKYILWDSWSSGTQWAKERRHSGLMSPWARISDLLWFTENGHACCPIAPTLLLPLTQASELRVMVCCSLTSQDQHTDHGFRLAGFVVWFPFCSCYGRRRGEVIAKSAPSCCQLPAKLSKFGQNVWNLDAVRDNMSGLLWCSNGSVLAQTLLKLENMGCPLSPYRPSLFCHS